MLLWFFFLLVFTHRVDLFDTTVMHEEGPVFRPTREAFAVLSYFVDASVLLQSNVMTQMARWANNTHPVVVSLE
jgi:hypothetical protein